MKPRIFSLVALFGLLLSGNAIADLHDPNYSADYIIVTTSEVIQNYPWVTELAAWRSDHGRTVLIVPVEDVWNDFGTGVPSDTALRDFLHYAHRNWQAPPLRDVFIVGCYDLVPTHLEPDSSQRSDSTWHVFTYASDFFYSADPDSANPVPVLGIGRLPWNAEQTPDMLNFFTKIQTYEQAPIAAWQRRVHLIADFQDISFNFVQDYCEPLAALVPSDYNIERNYLDYPFGHPWHGDRDEVLYNLESGSFFVSYQGHAGGGVWSGSMLVVCSDVANLTNLARLPIVMGGFYNVSCAPGGVVGSSFILNPNGGAIGYFANTYVGWAFAGRDYTQTLFHTVFSDSTLTLGDLWRKVEYQYVHEHSWSQGPMIPARMTALQSMLLGDPGLRLPDRLSPVPELGADIPLSLKLEQNYPNPFNPVTLISFDLSKDATASLKVYNTIGQEVAVLVNERITAGHHEVQFDGTNLPSGLYFYQLHADNMSPIAKKMMLLK